MICNFGLFQNSRDVSAIICYSVSVFFLNASQMTGLVSFVFLGLYQEISTLVNGAFLKCMRILVFIDLFELLKRNEFYGPLFKF